MTTGEKGANGQAFDVSRSVVGDDLSHLVPHSVEHHVTVGDTCVMGMVYFSRFVEWQGECRERWLFRVIPNAMKVINGDLLVMTHSCSCQYIGGVYAGDVISIRMVVPWVRLEFLRAVFSYYRVTGDSEELVATGEQTWVCVHRQGDVVNPGPWPEEIILTAKSWGADVSRALVT